jgi:hypothetical protein
MPNRPKKSNKKKGKKKEPKVILPYTKEERAKKIECIKNKLMHLELWNYDEDMINVQEKMKEFVETGAEYEDSVKLLGTKHVLHIILRNNNKKDCTLLLKYNENI